MNLPNDNWNRFDELLGALRDDELSENQSAELQHLLESRPGARRRFAELMHLTAMLSEDAPHGSSSTRQPASPSVTRQQRWTWNRPVISILLALGAAILLIVCWPGSQDIDAEALSTGPLDEGVAVVTQSYNALWSGSKPTKPGLQCFTRNAHIGFRSGSTGILSWRCRCRRRPCRPGVR